MKLLRYSGYQVMGFTSWDMSVEVTSWGMSDEVMGLLLGV